ncbi:MAG: carboxypeptidase regulatory-like domain-containing protein [Gemmatimonadetes bacterium]|nr:carboxypeptidase regulatory-like domain-containing protein [Gemmatimonadota bacterium]
MTASPLRRLLASRLLYVFLGLALPCALAAQGTSTLTGRVVDSTGAPIRGATVRVPQLERAAKADSTGQFKLDGLPTGRVTIVGEAPGFVGKRAEVTIPANGTVEQAFSLVPNAHVLANVEVRARTRKQLPLKLQEFAMRRNSSSAGRFLGPEDLVKYNGHPLTDALKTVMVGARFQRAATGEMNIISSRSLNPASIRQSANIKPCGVQIWQDGALLSDPNQSLEVMLPPPGGNNPNASRSISTMKVGADHDYDVSNLLTNDYMAVEYYSDLASTPPGFRTGTPSCGTLVLWTRVPDDSQQQVGQQQQNGQQGTQPQ